MNEESNVYDDSNSINLPTMSNLRSFSEPNNEVIIQFELCQGQVT